MKSFRALRLITLITIIVLPQSCRKDDPTPSNPIDKSPKLKKEMYFGALADTIPIVYTMYEYDDKWRLIKETGYSGSPNDYVTGYETYEYDTKNRLIKKSFFNGQNISFSGYDLYVYSRNNLIAREVYDEQGVFVNSHNSEYDKRGNIVKSWRLMADGNIFQLAYFEYDENNNCIKETGGSAFFIYGYDINNHLISLRAYSLPDSTPAQNYTYEYAGDLLIRHNYWDNKTGERWFMTEYFYDGNGNLIEAVDEKDGVRNVYKQFKYENNLMVEQVSYDRFTGYSINLITRYEYYIP